MPLLGRARLLRPPLDVWLQHGPARTRLELDNSDQNGDYKIDMKDIRAITKKFGWQ